MRGIGRLTDRGRHPGLWTVALFVLALGCRVDAATFAAEKVPIKVAFPSIQDFSDIPVLLTLERLRAEGYRTETILLSSPELTVEAVMRGDANIGLGADTVTLSAIHQGAPLRMIGAYKGNNWTILARAPIARPEELEGKIVAQHSPNAVSKGLTDAFMAEYAPHVRYHEQYIPGSENRADALLRGQIDASPVELVDVIRLQHQRPGAFNVIVTFQQALPLLSTSSVYTRNDFIRDHREVLIDFMAAFIQVQRELNENPELVKPAVERYLPQLASDPALDDIIRIHAESRMWAADGGLNRQVAEYSLEYWRNRGYIGPGFQAADVYDWTLIEDALRRLDSGPEE